MPVHSAPKAIEKEREREKEWNNGGETAMSEKKKLGKQQEESNYMQDSFGVQHREDKLHC